MRKQRLLAKQAQHREASSSSLNPSLSEILEEVEMAKERPRITLGDHAAATSTTHLSSIATPAIAATNFEMKPTMLNLIQNNQFVGLDHDDQYLHLHTFIELCGTMKIHQVLEEVIQMKLFPFSLLGKAKMWFYALPHQSLIRWSDIETKILARFFPLAKINQAKSEIVTFSQKQDELLSEAWERYKSLLRRSGGSMRFKTPEEAIELIDVMAANDYDLPAERESRQKRGILELGYQDALLAQNKLLKYINTFPSHGEEVNYMGNQARQGGNYGGNYGKNWQSHPSIGWNQNDIAQSSRPPMQREVEKIMRKKRENEKENVIEGEKLAEEVAVKKSKSQLAREVKMKSKVSSTKDVPYPQAPSKKDKEKQFARFMELLKKLQINIPFLEALEQMPTYAKFMKDLLTKKKKFIEQEIIELEARALLDLGASINLMPLSMLDRVGQVVVKSTRMTLQLVDRSIKYPYGVIENMLVKVDKFTFPADFVILDMEEDSSIPIILGRPFMKTARAIIDVENGEFKLRVHDEVITFNVFEAMTHSNDKGACFRMDVLDEVVCEAVKKLKKSISGDVIRLKPFPFSLLGKAKLWLNSYGSAKHYKERVKLYHERKILKQEFQPEQLVLLHNSRLRLFLGKLKSKWSRPFRVK
uniref:Retrotransposon gag domain-containing protein n=1 Tax=Cajanus cajan TaxID=3821 RepID=A0A151RCJ7_CAJCA|nr:hypothetical protein KK1_038276 [Cajanus cajan]